MARSLIFALALAACTHSDPSTDTPEGSSDCVSGAAIQEALDDGALSVVVCPGVHAVHLEIPDGVVLEGTGLAADTVLDGTDTGIPVTVMANAEVVLKHLTVTRGVTETPEAAAGVHALTAHSLTLEDCIVENGTGWAGGIAGPIPGLVTLTDVTVQDNVGDGVGGLYGHAMNLTRVTLSGNEGTGDLGTGGLYVLGLVDAPAVAVADAETVVRDNVGHNLGGGILIDHYSTWRGGQVRDNHAPGGGGIAALNVTDIAISDVVIADNTATVGGGFFANSTGISGVILTDATLSGNEASESGGGVHWLAADGELTIADSQVTDNQAPVGAGFLVSDGQLSLDTTAVLRNTATVEGGGVALTNQGSITCTACDFGVPPDDNLPDDVAISGFAPANYGAEANFSCSAESGTCVDD